MIFIFIMYMKIVSHFGGDIASSATGRNLQGIVQNKNTKDPFGWNWFSENNFKFYSWINGDFEITN